MIVEPVLKVGAIDLRLECGFHENITSDNLTAYIRVIYEELIIDNQFAKYQFKSRWSPL